MACDSPLAVGIDLGTTYCCIGVLRHRDKNPEIIPNEENGKDTTPSYVAYNFDEEGEDEEIDIVVGQSAKDMAHQNIESTVYDVKRLIGRTFHDHQIKLYKEQWPFRLVNDRGMVAVKIGSKILLPQDITKEIMSHLLKTAKNFLGFPIQSAVVTVPAYFNDLQRDLTREACINSGLENVHFISEPTAAAFAYSLQSTMKPDKNKKTCLVFDLGGGTFDLSIFTLYPGPREGDGRKIEIKAIGGNSKIGGEDFNEKLIEYCVESYKGRYGIDLLEGKNSSDQTIRLRTLMRLRRLRKECERQKCFLSNVQAVSISLDGLHQDKMLHVKITREKFEELISGLLTKCMETMKKLMRDKRIMKQDIDDVVLIGGSTRIPKVRELVCEFFGGKRIHDSIDVDTAVACGAAILAYNTFTVKNGAETVTLAEMKENAESYDPFDFDIIVPANNDSLTKIDQESAAILNPIAKDKEKESIVTTKVAATIENTAASAAPASPGSAQRNVYVNSSLAEKLINQLGNFVLKDYSFLQMKIKPINEMTLESGFKFHPVHGKNIQLSPNRTVAERVHSFNHALVFSHRPVKVNEKVKLKVIGLNASWRGTLRIGFTNKDPNLLKNSLPILDDELTSREGIWGKAFRETDNSISEGNIISFWFNSAGDVFYEVNGSNGGKFFSGVSTLLPLWGLVDVYGNTVKLELTSETYSNKR